jgi:hypothetical protein
LLAGGGLPPGISSRLADGGLGLCAPPIYGIRRSWEFESLRAALGKGWKSAVCPRLMLTGGGFVPGFCPEIGAAFRGRSAPGGPGSWRRECQGGQRRRCTADGWWGTSAFFRDRSHLAGAA